MIGKARNGFIGNPTLLYININMNDKVGISKLLTETEVKKLAGANTKVIIYPDLRKYDTLQELFGGDTKVIILYLNEKEGENYVGHWVLLSRRVEKGKNIVEFNDSYSNFIDEYFDDIPQAKREQLDQENGYLSRLLYDWCQEDEANNQVHYNEMELQKLGVDINTCGRWVGLRARFNEVPLKDWQTEFKKLKKEGYDLDLIITLITDNLLSLK